MGSYGILLDHCVDVAFVNCRQDNIMDHRYWGLFGSNYCRDILVEGCVFSRVDAHKGVTGYTIRDSYIGYMGIKAIGGGLMRVENVRLSSVWPEEGIDLRNDYGSGWDGDLIIKDLTWRPGKSGACLIRAVNRGSHDFGYPCGLPRKIVIENLTVLDGDLPEGTVSLLPVHPETNVDVKGWKDREKGDEPYVFTEILEVRGVTTQSGRGVRLFAAPPDKCYAAVKGKLKDGTVTPNFRAYIDDVDALHISLSGEDQDYYGTHRLLPEIHVRNCPVVTVNRGKNPGIIEVE
jgi:hypothetical protein